MTTDGLDMDDDNDDVEALTVKANRARARLLETVDAIDRKGHDALNVGLQVRKHAEPIAIGGGAIVLEQDPPAYWQHRFLRRRHRF